MDFTSATAMLLQPEHPWRWINKWVVTDPLIHKYFYANPNNEGKLFTPLVRVILVQVSAPRLISSPAAWYNSVFKPSEPLT